MDPNIEAIKMLISHMENPTRIYLQRGLVKRVNEGYCIFLDNTSLVQKYARDTVQGKELQDVFANKLGLEVIVRHISEMTAYASDSDELNSEEIELVKAYRKLNQSQKELIRRIIVE